MVLKIFVETCSSYISCKTLNIHLFLKYLLDNHFVPGTDLDTVGKGRDREQTENKM